MSMPSYAQEMGSRPDADNEFDWSEEGELESLKEEALADDENKPSVVDLKDIDRILRRKKNYTAKIDEIKLLFEDSIKEKESELINLRLARDRAIAPWERRVKYIEAFFGPTIAEFLRCFVGKTKERGVTLPSGRAGFSKQRLRYNVVDKETLIPIVENLWPDAIKRDILVSKLPSPYTPGTIEEDVYEMFGDEYGKEVLEKIGASIKVEGGEDILYLSVE